MALKSSNCTGPTASQLSEKPPLPRAAGTRRSYRGAGRRLRSQARRLPWPHAAALPAHAALRAKASPLPPPAPLLGAAGIQRASECHPHPKHQLSLLQRAVHGLHFWSNNPTLLPPSQAFSGPDSRQTQGAPGTWTPEHPYFWAVSSQNMPPGLPTDGYPGPPEGSARCVPGLVGLLRAVLC